MTSTESLHDITDLSDLDEIDMQERAGELEARRLLSQLDYAKIDETVCDETVAAISNLLSLPWEMCDENNANVLLFLTAEKKTWANQGFRIIIEGGNQYTRRRVMNYCIYMGILARFQSFTYIAKTYDWPSILPIIGDFKHTSKHSITESMQTIEVLGITEIDLLQPRDNGGVEGILTSILRSRWLSKKPTIITLKRPSKSCKGRNTGEIDDIAEMKHSVEEMVVRLNLKGVQ
jgi:hypothetical protein